MYKHARSKVAVYYVNICKCTNNNLINLFCGGGRKRIYQAVELFSVRAFLR